jgi:hypothetical protein
MLSIGERDRFNGCISPRSEEQLLQKELKLKSDIEEVKRKKKELERETMALKCIKMTLMSDISLQSINFSHHISK